MIVRIVGLGGLAALAVAVQNLIPGVKNLYDWAFPLIVAIVVFAFLIFIAAVRLQMPRNAALLKLAHLETKGYGVRESLHDLKRLEKGLESLKAEVNDWNTCVAAQLELRDPVVAAQWIVPDGKTLRGGGGGDWYRLQAVVTFQLSRLPAIIEKFKR